MIGSYLAYFFFVFFFWLNKNIKIGSINRRRLGHLRLRRALIMCRLSRIRWGIRMYLLNLDLEKMIGIKNK